MAQNTAELVVGATGAVYVAPVGTALPVSIAATLNVAFVDLGLITEDGITVSPSVSQEVIRAWQLLTRVRTIITERDFELEFAMMQWNETTLPFAMGGGSITTDLPGPPAEYSYDFPDADVRDERAMIVEWQDGTKDYRLVIPRLEVTDLASFTVARTDTANLGVTVNVVSNPADAYTMRLQSSDTSFAA
jgi:hypothetical protein